MEQLSGDFAFPVIDRAYVNSVCELLTEKNQLLTHGRIIAIDANKIDIQQKDDDFSPTFRFAMPVKINVFNMRLGLKVLAGVIHGSGGGKVRVAGAEVLQDSDRREFVRVSVQKSGVVYRAADVEKSSPALFVGAAPLKSRSEPTRARIENISLSGVQFSSFERFLKGDRLLVLFAPIADTIRLQCEVVRVFKDDLDRIHCGCRFLQMYDEHVNELSKIIMRIQLAQRSKKD